MDSITRFGDAELETKIAAIVAITSQLAKDGRRNRSELRRRFAELAKLKTQRTAVEVYRLECERGLGELV